MGFLDALFDTRAALAAEAAKANAAVDAALAAWDAEQTDDLWSKVTKARERVEQLARSAKAEEEKAARKARAAAEKRLAELEATYDQETLRAALADDAKAFGDLAVKAAIVAERMEAKIRAAGAAVQEANAIKNELGRPEHEQSNPPMFTTAVSYANLEVQRRLRDAGKFGVHVDRWFAADWSRKA